MKLASALVLTLVNRSTCSLDENFFILTVRRGRDSSSVAAEIEFMAHPRQRHARVQIGGGLHGTVRGPSCGYESAGQFTFAVI